MKRNHYVLGAYLILLENNVRVNATYTVLKIYVKLMEFVLVVAIILSLVLDVPKTVVLTVCTVAAKIGVKNVSLDSTCTGQLVQEHALLNVSIVHITVVKSASPDFLDAGVVVVVLHNV